MIKTSFCKEIVFKLYLSLFSIKLNKPETFFFSYQNQELLTFAKNTVQNQTSHNNPLMHKSVTSPLGPFLSDCTRATTANYTSTTLASLFKIFINYNLNSQQRSSLRVYNEYVPTKVLN